MRKYALVFFQVCNWQSDLLIKHKENKVKQEYSGAFFSTVVKKTQFAEEASGWLVRG